MGTAAARCQRGIGHDPIRRKSNANVASAGPAARGHHDGRRRAGDGPRASLRRGRDRRGRPARRLARNRERTAHRGDGPVGIGQVDAHAHPGRPRPPDGRPRNDRRQGHHRRRRHRAHEAPPRAHRLHLPVLQPPADAHRAGERRPAGCPRRGQAGRRLGRRADRPGRPHRPALAPARGDVGRPAAARRDRAGAGLPPHDRLRRRADRQPRLDHERRDPRAPARLGDEPRADDRDGHARSPCRRDRRPDRVPRRRPRRPGPRRMFRAPDPRSDGGGERTMIAVALKGLLGRKVRAILTAFAIVLGVAMVSGTFVLTDTIERAFNGVFTSSYKDTSVTVSGKEIVKGSLSGRSTVPAGLLAKVRAQPDVAAAAGQIVDFSSNADTVKLVDAKGKTLGGHAPTFGFGIDASQPRFNPLQLSSGAWPVGPHQVVIDAGTAKKNHYRPGDTITAAASGPKHHYTITGTAKLGGLTSTGGATIAVFDVPTAQALLDKEGRYDAISVAATSGVSQDRLAAELGPLVPATAQVKTADDQARADKHSTSKGIGGIRAFLLAFGAIALFVGAFVIFNTISITVAQRTREFATLRTLGASRRQVLRSVLLESIVIGLLASVIGLFLGLGLARGLNAIFVAIGIDLPQTSPVLATRTVLVSLAIGTLVTLLAGIFPAVRATRVPPIAAVREGSTPPATKLSRLRPVAAGVVIALAVGLIAVGLFAGSTGVSSILVPLAAGTLLLFIGIAMISSHLVRPLAAVVGLPARRFGRVAGRLAGENSARNTPPTATTAAALMIGLALVTFVAVLGSGLRSSDVDALDHQVRSDYVVTAKNADTFSAAAGGRVASAPGVTLASSVRTDQARVLGKTIAVAGVDPSTIGRAYRFDWAKGSDAPLAALGGDGAILDAKYATAHHLTVGSRLKLQTASGRTRAYVVRATHRPPQIDSLFTGIVISRASFDRVFPRPADLFTFASVSGGASPAATARLGRVLAAFPDARLQTKPAWVKERADTINVLLGLFYVLLALSVVISLFGMVNTLVLSVFERTRELGMLRAVGMTRLQMRRMIRHESIITASIGAALGLPLGLFLAALVTQALSSDGVGLHVPLLPLAVFAAIAVLAGTLAAVVPARRAARLNVLAALHYE